MTMYYMTMYYLVPPMEIKYIQYMKNEFKSKYVGRMYIDVDMVDCKISHRKKLHT